MATSPEHNELSEQSNDQSLFVDSDVADERIKPNQVHSPVMTIVMVTAHSGACG